MNGEPSKLGSFWRVALAVTATVGFGLLITARVLTPNPHGVGTHRQLGFPPCGVLLRYGRPCPACGMTTSWSLLTRGRVIESVKSNPAGAYLGVMVFVLSAWSLLPIFTGRWYYPPSEWFLLGAAIVFLLLAMVVWIFRFFF